MRTRIAHVLRLSLAVLGVVVSAAAQEMVAYDGRVLDEQGAPLAGVAVCALPKHDRWLPDELVAAATVRTDGDGRFRIEVEKGTATEALFVARGRVHTVQRLDRLAVWPVQLAKARTLAGRVRDADGAPVAGARIVATDFVRGMHILQDRDQGNTQEQLRAVARTDEAGRFVLAGVYGTALRLAISKAGYDDLALGPVSVLDPLDLSLTKVGLVEGVVLDAQGLPAGGLPVWMSTRETPRVTRSTYTDERGRYALTWTQRPARLSVTRFGDGPRQSVQCDVDEPGSYELRLVVLTPRPAPTPEQVAAATPKVAIAATGPDGAPVASFRVAVFRFDPEQQKFRTDRKQLEGFAEAAVDGVDGAAVAPIRDGGGSSGLLVLARAAGCATARVEADVDAKQVAIRLEAAAPVVGKVIDRATDAPIVGARVWFLPDLDGKNQHDREFEALGESVFRVTSGDDGGFVLADPPRGEGRVFVVAEGYEPAWVPCEVGAQAGTLELKVDRLVSLPGKLDVTPLPTAFVGVRPLRTQPGASSSDHHDLKGLVPLAADAALRFADLAPVEHHFELVSLRAPRQGRPDKMMLASLRVGPEVARIDLDASKARPSRVRGRVTGPVPVQRLAVLCSPPYERNMGYAYLQYRGPLCPLGIDGRYDIRELPGERILAVIDVETGVLFARGEQVTVTPGGERTQDFAIDAAPLTVKVVRGEAEGQGGDQFVELLPPREFWPGLLGQIVEHDGQIQDYCLGMGIRVPAGVDEVTLWLPKVPFDLTLRAYSEYNGARAQSPHGRVVSAEPGRDTTVTVGW